MILSWKYPVRLVIVSRVPIGSFCLPFPPYRSVAFEFASSTATDNSCCCFTTADLLLGIGSPVFDDTESGYTYRTRA
jgi:hypothetical protein